MAPGRDRAGGYVGFRSVGGNCQCCIVRFHQGGVLAARFFIEVVIGIGVFFFDVDETVSAQPGHVLAYSGAGEWDHLAKDLEGGDAMFFQVEKYGGAGWVGDCFIPDGLAIGGIVKEVSFGHCHGEVGFQW